MYAKLRSGSEDGQNRGGSTENRRWRYIRELSVLGFVDKVSRSLGAPNDRKLREILYESALGDGMPVRFGSCVYTPAMQLDIYHRRDESGDA